MENWIWIIIAIMLWLLNNARKRTEKRDRTPSYENPPPTTKTEEATNKWERQSSTQYKEDDRSLPWKIDKEESSLETVSSEERIPGELDTGRHDKFHKSYLPESQAYLRKERKPPEDEVSFDSELSFPTTEERHKGFHKRYPTGSELKGQKKTSLLKEVTESLGEPGSIKKAIILAEILSPPRAKRRLGRK